MGGQENTNGSESRETGEIVIRMKLESGMVTNGVNINANDNPFFLSRFLYLSQSLFLRYSPRLLSSVPRDLLHLRRSSESHSN